ncbi:hypothetical protein [Thermoproteus tenax]|uniref:Uncharacterized protein n=1 Tax=Thermoproteus tenax (strain ATCC 35583 / DSM 2078 / JCM 9277 / NBRC 100435 / Kra 1) TaxID=768679 RepID=G4RNX4_THETK|nr:hypothetical protein [Thermoproteus tenax]CCC81268.1 hypothetical protein TTX_0608 [Thermoproteus tenax Kra 1]
MWEEVPTLLIAAAAIILAIAAVVLGYFNPQAPADYAYAEVAPIVKPYNSTFVYIGAVGRNATVTEVSYIYGGRTYTFAVDRLAPPPPPNGTWLAVVPCGANVTVVARYGVATRAQTWTPVCINRPQKVVSYSEEAIRELTEFASFVAQYTLYKSIPVLGAYLRFGSVETWIKNIGPFPYWAAIPSRNIPTLILEPGEGFRLDDFTTTVTGTVYRWVYTAGILEGNRLTLWINGVLAYNGTVTNGMTIYAPQGYELKYINGYLVPIYNGAPIYNGTSVKSNTSNTVIYKTTIKGSVISTPQGYNVTIILSTPLGIAYFYNGTAIYTSQGYEITIDVPLLTRIHSGPPVVGSPIGGSPVGNTGSGASQPMIICNVMIYASSYTPSNSPTYVAIPANGSWMGWLKFDNAPLPVSPLSETLNIYVMPSSPNYTSSLFGLIPPWRTYMLTVNPTTGEASWYDPQCNAINYSCLRTAYVSNNSVLYINDMPGGEVVAIGKYFVVGVGQLVSYRDTYGNVHYGVTILWYPWGGAREVINDGNSLWNDFGNGLYTCYYSAYYPDQNIVFFDGFERNSYTVVCAIGGLWIQGGLFGGQHVVSFTATAYPNYTLVVTENGKEIGSVTFNPSQFPPAPPMFVTYSKPASNSLPVAVRFGSDNYVQLVPFTDSNTYAGYISDATGNYGLGTLIYKQTYDLTGAYNYTLVLQGYESRRLIKTYREYGEVDIPLNFVPAGPQVTIQYNGKWITCPVKVKYSPGSIYPQYYCAMYGYYNVYVYNITVVEQLTLYLFGKPVAYDALMGSYVYTTETPVPVRPLQITIKPICTPTKRLLGGAAVSRLEGNNTLVTYFNETIQVTGCGQDYTYYEPVKVATSMVNGADYVRDPYTGQLCSYPYTTQDNQTGWLTCNNGRRPT